MLEKRSRVSKSQWLDKALEAFEKGGVNAVKIDHLARELGVAKSGFYWHFKNRGELLNEMLEYWEYEYTTSVIHFLENQKELTAEQQLLTIMRIVRENNMSCYDLAILSWATVDEKANEYFQQSYQARYSTVKQLFKSLGFKGNDLENRTRMFVIYESWNQNVFTHDSDTKLTALEKERLKFYTN